VSRKWITFAIAETRNTNPTNDGRNLMSSPL
jgi:hypothetical protein